LGKGGKRNSNAERLFTTCRSPVKEEIKEGVRSSQKRSKNYGPG